MLFAGHDLLRYTPEKIVALGCSLVPEGRQVFAPMTVMENLVLEAMSSIKKTRR